MRLLQNILETYTKYKFTAISVANRLRSQLLFREAWKLYQRLLGVVERKRYFMSFTM